jgi:hypothetical protein
MAVMSPMPESWFIDAWAPTEGLVFASRRPSRSDPWSAEFIGASDARVQTFAIAAPSFEPQPVDRSAAFGAARRGFQERFSVDGETEYAFASLDQLITFARRIYSGSGPGTMGGGGEPPEPGPEPDGDGGAPFQPYDDFIRARDALGSTGDELLRILKDSRTRADRTSAIERLMTEAVVHNAAVLLLQCADSGSMDRRVPMRWFRAAGSLTRSIDIDWWYRWASKLEPRLPPGEIEYLWRRGVLPFGLREDRLTLAGLADAPFPIHLVRAYRLPLSIRTMLDLATYIAGDRRYVVASDLSALLALLIAVAAHFSFDTVAADWDLGGQSSFDQLRKSCSRYIADWLPVDELPEKLEHEVRRWCWRGPRGQRSNGSQRSEGE